MAVSYDSTRFGRLELEPDQLLRFPLGLIGIPGSDYALVATKPGAAILWLQSLHDPGFALPIVDPRLPYPDFELKLSAADEQLVAQLGEGERQVFVTVAAKPDPQESTVNLRAPLVIVGRVGFQLLNEAPGAELRAPLCGQPAQAAA